MFFSCSVWFQTLLRGLILICFRLFLNLYQPQMPALLPDGKLLMSITATPTLFEGAAVFGRL